MKRAIWVSSFLLLFLLGSTCLAGSYSPIQLMVNGSLVPTDVPPQIIQNHALLPVRTLAHALGASVIWDNQNRIITITSETQKQARRIELLEQALAPQTAEDTVKRWAEGVKSRNGALQFALLSPELRELLEPEFESLNWVTGTSSPWVDVYTIRESKKPSNDTHYYTIKYELTDSSKQRYPEQEHIVIRQIGDRFYVVKTDRFKPYSS